MRNPPTLRPIGNSAISRSFHVVRYLKLHGSARFSELAEQLAPISKTTLSHLLASMVKIGELTHEGRSYALHPQGGAALGPQRGIYSLPRDLRAETHKVLEEVALETMHSCALFGWVGISTMRILNICNLENTDWFFNPVGYEWPLIPFHGFAQLFLAHAPEALALECFYRWYTSLQEHLRFSSSADFRKRLNQIRKDGYVIEYRGEVPTILRIGVPVCFGGEAVPRYVVGLAANAIHILDADRGLAHLKTAARKLSVMLEGRAPLFRFEELDAMMRHVEKDLRKRDR